MEATNTRRIYWAGILGNCLELYDYALYGCFAPIFATLFFPSQSYLAVYGVYAAGFLMRPIGGLLIGYIGDNYGRKKALEISILLMAIPTLCIGLLPTYQQIGFAAPCLLVFFRLLQGISVGGELIGSYAYLIEHAPKGKKGEAGGYAMVGCFGGKLLGSLTAFILFTTLSPPQLESFGWRLAFFFGMFFALFGFLLRKKLTETPVFLEMKAKKNKSKIQIKTIIHGICALVVHTTSLQIFFIYFPVYFKNVLGMSFQWATFSTTLSLFLVVITTPFFARWSDTLGFQRQIFLGSGLMGIFILPAFILMGSGDPYLILLTHLTLSLIFAFGYCSYPAYLMELFPPSIRCTGSSIAYNLGVGLFGGLTPMLSTFLVEHFNPIAPAFWILTCSLITTFSVYPSKTNIAIYQNSD